MITMNKVLINKLLQIKRKTMKNVSKGLVNAVQYGKMRGTTTTNRTNYTSLPIILSVLKNRENMVIHNINSQKCSGDLGRK